MDLKRFVHEYEWVHTLIGIAGNTLFVVGSFLFLQESTKGLGVWAFIVGSTFMLIGSVGSAMKQVWDGHQRAESEDPSGGVRSPAPRRTAAARS